MMFPPFAATSRVAPIAVNFRRALTTTRLNHSISAVTCTCLNKGHSKSVQTIARTKIMAKADVRTGTACSAVSTSSASSLPRPSYTNLDSTLNVVSCARPLCVRGELYASWRQVCLRSSWVYARWYVALNVPVQLAASGRLCTKQNTRAVSLIALPAQKRKEPTCTRLRR